MTMQTVLFSYVSPNRHTDLIVAEFALRISSNQVDELYNQIHHVSSNDTLMNQWALHIGLKWNLFLLFFPIIATVSYLFFWELGTKRALEQVHHCILNIYRICWVDLFFWKFPSIHVLDHVHRNVYWISSICDNQSKHTCLDNQKTNLLTSDPFHSFFYTSYNWVADIYNNNHVHNIHMTIQSETPFKTI